MKIVTAANAAFASILALTMPANYKHYGVRLYDLGGLGAGRPFEVPPFNPTKPERIVGRCPYKPRIILDALMREEDEILVWLDADAWVIRPMPEMHSEDYDIAVTMRRMSDRGRSDWPDVYGYLQAGVVFVNRTAAAEYFLKDWISEVSNTDSQSDQHALNNLVREACDLTKYDAVYRRGYTRIKILDGEKYNWCYLPEEPRPDTRILHCKTDLRQHVDLAQWTARKWE